jgi:kumamolisin
MKKLLPIVAVLVSLLTIVQPVLASLPTSSVSPITTSTNLSSSNILPLLSQSGVTNIGTVDPTQQLSITVSLKLRNKDALKERIKTAHANHKSGKIVSDVDMVTNYSPDSNTHNKLLNFLTSNGLTVTKTYGNHMAIQVSGSASAVEKAFNVSLNNYTDNGTSFYANSTEPQLPSDIASSVESIDGLNDIQLKPSSTSTSFPASPQEMQKAYDATPLYANNINGKGINIAVASYYSFKQSDITTYLNYFNITGTNPVNIVNIDGTPTYNNHAGSDETTLDLESVLSSAPGAQITLYDGANPSSSTETDTFTRIVDDGTVNVVTYSWGENESDFSPSEINALDSLFVAGSAKGMTFLVASGDSGSSEIDYPATDPYITCVGGTTVALNNATGLIASETGWAGSGGGSSAYFSKPTWQSGLGGSTTAYRTIPDVASDADPDSGYMIYSNGRWGEVGGTSVASPEWAGILALADQERIANGLGTLGAANSELYALANSGVYNDITSGSNGSYSCRTGYDMVTGLGTPDVYKLVTALGGAQTTPVNAPTTVPTGVTASAASSTQVNLTWTAVPSATSYKIYRTTSSSLIPVLVGSSQIPTFSDTDLTKSTTYYYAVSAVGTSGESSQSALVSVTTLSSSSIASPTGLTATPASSSQISLAWTPVSGAISYKIYSSQSSAGTYTLIGTSGVPSYTSTALVQKTTYYYKVSVVNSSGEGPQSAVVSATTLQAPILAKLSINGTIPALTAGGTGVSLSNTLIVSGIDQSGNSFSLKGLNITWTIPSSITCATVSNGLLKPVTAGSGTVYASVNGISSNSLTFTVSSAVAIAINSVQASNGMVLLYLNEVPKTLPTLSQFSVAQSINGATAVVTKVIAGVERGNEILLQIARNKLTSALQSVYDTVSYLGGTSVKSNTFTIR